MNKKKTVATISLAGCFGCHMSFLDLDLNLIELFTLVDLRKSPLTDIKELDDSVDIGIIEGGVCNNENVEVLRAYRKKCKILISLGECAIMGGLPALRNNIPLSSCLKEAYINGPTTNSLGIIPQHEDIPEILDKVYPCHEVVKIDYFIPGCPPSGETIWTAIKSIVAGEDPHFSYEMIKYD